MGEARYYDGMIKVLWPQFCSARIASIFASSLKLSVEMAPAQIHNYNIFLYSYLILIKYISY